MLSILAAHRVYKTERADESNTVGEEDMEKGTTITRGIISHTRGIAPSASNVISTPAAAFHLTAVFPPSPILRVGAVFSLAPVSAPKFVFRLAAMAVAAAIIIGSPKTTIIRSDTYVFRWGARKPATKAVL